jgi:hypothetical protein
MKEMNLPETQLRSWQPRRPSARLERRIFAAPHLAPRVVVWSLRCLAPAAACLLVAVAVFHQGGSVPGGTVHGDSLAGAGWSNQIAYVPGHYQPARNAVSPPTLEWTNRNGSTSSISPLSGRMN